jgi:hypothetical protein
MKVKSRPLSSKPQSQTNIFIDSSDDESDPATLKKVKQKLNYIIPEMPAFVNTNSLAPTALLYSKFIVKGMKNDKINMVKDHFKMKK